MLDSTGTSAKPVRDNSSNRLRIRVGSIPFQATLLNNATVTAFKARLPLTLAMKELNGNEKFADLPTSLPTNATNPGTIQSGDLMLYGSNTLVLFYEPFRTSYSYTKLGRIDNPTSLAAALGSGNITVSLEMEL
ncbi:cyclophilin-like fold protein [Larkinella insperata]|uniref:Cyclophilin-like fold protein n=1 Tax=Larkinella insperata TaxID=332158 RepID=A0ABW3QGT0_9BACT